jgi:hypothetical protein
LEIVAVAGLGLNLSPLPNRTTSAFNFRRHRTLIAYRRPDDPRRKGVISRSSINLFMCTGGAHRPFLHDRNFSAASSFQIGVSRGRRIRIEWNARRGPN